MNALDRKSCESCSSRERRGIQSVEAGGQLLLALGTQGHPMPLRALAKAARMSPGKAYPYLVSFSKLGLVTQEPSTGYYWLGPTAMQLGLATLRMVRPAREAIPFAEQLARETGHSVALSVWASQGPTVVFLFDAIYPTDTNMRTGTVMSLACTATGRLFAAYLPPKLIEDSLLEARQYLGPDTSEPIDAAELQSMLGEVRKHGMARSINSPSPGICAFAAPVFDHAGNIVLAITLAGKAQSFATDWDGALAKAVKACGLAASQHLGKMPSQPATNNGHRLSEPPA